MWKHWPMRGLVLEAVGSVVLRDDLPDPKISDPGDAVVAVGLAGLCGSDLHPYEGREAARFGVVPGHEVVGEVVATGPGVSELATGDRVIVPFTTSCGACAACHRGLSSRCRHGRLFGYGAPGPGAAPPLHGGQADLVRVPLADSTLVRVPAAIADLDAVLLTDNLPTAWYAVERADVGPDGGGIAVVGLGSVGLCAVHCALTLGLGPVLAVDPVADRRARAARMGATAVAPDEALQTAVDLSGGARLPGVVEAAGTEAAQRLAASMVAPGGTLSIIAVPTSAAFAFTPVEAYGANLTVRTGRAPVRSLLDRLVPMLESGRLNVPTDAVVTHPGAPLDDGPGLYRDFAARRPGLVKAVFVPGA